MDRNSSIIEMFPSFCKNVLHTLVFKGNLRDFSPTSFLILLSAHIAIVTATSALPTPAQTWRLKG